MVTALKWALNPAQQSLLFFIKLAFPLREMTYYTFFFFPISHTLSLSQLMISAHTSLRRYRLIWKLSHLPSTTSFLLSTSAPILLLPSYFHQVSGLLLITAWPSNCSLHPFPHSFLGSCSSCCPLFCSIITINQKSKKLQKQTALYKHPLSVSVHGKTSRVVSCNYCHHFLTSHSISALANLVPHLCRHQDGSWRGRCLHVVEFSGPCSVFVFINLTVAINSVEPFSSPWSIFLFYLIWPRNSLVSFKVLLFSTQSLH